jgi:hypothetical protein
LPPPNVQSQARPMHDVAADIGGNLACGGAVPAHRPVGYPGEGRHRRNDARSISCKEYFENLAAKMGSGWFSGWQNLLRRRLRTGRSLPATLPMRSPASTVWAMQTRTTSLGWRPGCAGGLPRPVSRRGAARTEGRHPASLLPCADEASRCPTPTAPDWS